MMDTETQFIRVYKVLRRSHSQEHRGEPFLFSIKTVDTIGNCQRLAFNVGVSQHMHKITNLWKFELKRSSKLRDNYERKNTLGTRSCVLSDSWFRNLNSKLEVLKSNSWTTTSFSKTTVCIVLCHFFVVEITNSVNWIKTVYCACCQEPKLTQKRFTHGCTCNFTILGAFD